MLDLLKEKFTPQELPVHVVIPSLIGYGFSSPPPIDKDFTTSGNAVLFDQVMTGLGFSKYAAQGGDIGSFVSRSLSQKPACHGEWSIPVHSMPVAVVDQIQLFTSTSFPRQSRPTSQPHPSWTALTRSAWSEANFTGNTSSPTRRNMLRRLLPSA